MLKAKIEGRHLWAVHFDKDIYGSLWITTCHHDSEEATRKAKKFLKHHRKEYPGVVIEKIFYRGTLDA